MVDICYYCGKAATSVEHVPPKTIFPKPKDSPASRDYRKNLITVRSCDEHNSKKSKDDEYLLYVLAMSLPSNDIAKHQFLTKVRRAIERRPALLQKLLMKFREVTLHDTVNNTWSKSIALQPDHTRLMSIFTHIAKAIYFLETGKIWQSEVTLLIEFLISLENIPQNERQAKVEQAANEFFANISHKGENKNIFTYQFVELEGRAMLRLHFFGNSKVSASF
ncbi:MAG: hypothetical protein Q8J90_03535 [Gallionella sp.]|nr:hypothetical protein [Gallionella sp.]